MTSTGCTDGWELQISMFSEVKVLHPETSTPHRNKASGTVNAHPLCCHIRQDVYITGRKCRFGTEVTAALETTR